jgi:hypothetical protein
MGAMDVSTTQDRFADTASSPTKMPFPLSDTDTVGSHLAPPPADKKVPVLDDSISKRHESLDSGAPPSDSVDVPSNGSKSQFEEALSAIASRAGVSLGDLKNLSLTGIVCNVVQDVAAGLELPLAGMTRAMGADPGETKAWRALNQTRSGSTVDYGLPSLTIDGADHQ